MAYGDLRTKVIVAIEGGNNDWTAYEFDSETYNMFKARQTLLTLADAILEVRSNGRKLQYSEAKVLFPELDVKLTWRF